MPQKLPVHRAGSDFFAPYFWNPMRLASWWDEDVGFPMRQSVNRMFRDLGDIMESWPAAGLEGAEPFVEDVCEDSKSFCLRLGVPGLEQGDISISTSGNTLKVEAERHEKKNGAESHYSYSRSMSLPENVDVSKADATLSNHVLTIEIPKTNGHETRQKIAIKSGGEAKKAKGA